MKERRADIIEELEVIWKEAPESRYHGDVPDYIEGGGGSRNPAGTWERLGTVLEDEEGDGPRAGWRTRTVAGARDSSGRAFWGGAGRDRGQGGSISVAVFLGAAREQASGTG
jgi:hypothetical protein